MIETERNMTLVVIITNVKTYIISAPTATRDLNYISLSKLQKDSNKKLRGYTEYVNKSSVISF